MDIIQTINTRRSVRKYLDKPVNNDTMRELIRLGTMAATGSGLEPWGFVVLQNKEEIDALSEAVKQDLLAHFDEVPHLHRYEKWLHNPKLHVFNHAHTLLVIYGNTQSYYHQQDGTLAAANIMLAAHSMGIGSCWIGFAEFYLDTPAFKKAHNIPEEFKLVCPLSMGYTAAPLAPPTRKEPLVFGIFEG